jgi:hypothetical protein
MPSYQIENPIDDLTMQRFRSVADQYGGLARSARFIARIMPTGSSLLSLKATSILRDLIYLCDVIDIPGRELGTQNVHYYGPELKYPVQTAYADFDMTFICRNGSFERQFFDDWMTLINPPNSYDFNYIDNYKAEIDIFTFADHGRPKVAVSKDPQNLASNVDENITTPVANYNITLHRAFPIIVHQQPSTWADGEFHRLMVTFSYYNWTRRNRDMDPQRGYTLVEGRDTGGR